MSDIQAIGDWKDNAELIADAAKLGYLPEPVLDLTYGQGGFWRQHTPSHIVTNDLDPDSPCECHRDFRATSFGTGEFSTVVFDPPYKLGGTPASPKMDKRYGTQEYRTRSEMFSLFVGGMAEASRLAKRFMLVKCQDQVNGGKVRWQTSIAIDVARALEWRHVDSLILKGGRAQPDDTTQQHARHAYSTLLIFGKGDRS